MNYSYDLHIHSCLSPCGDDDMTPADIVALSAMFGLHFVALTDHNSCKNCPALFAAAEELAASASDSEEGRIVPIAGAEVTTAEEIHAVCLFPALAAAMEFDEVLYNALPSVTNNEDMFGRQIITDSGGAEIGTSDKLLISATSIGIYDLAALVAGYGGVMFPAHIERAAFSLISQLGDVPGDCGFNTVEIRSKAATDNLKSTYAYLNECRILYNSDAHSLDKISPGGEVLNLPCGTVAALLDYIRNDV